MCVSEDSVQHANQVASAARNALREGTSLATHQRWNALLTSPSVRVKNTTVSLTAHPAHGTGGVLLHALITGDLPGVSGISGISGHNRTNHPEGNAAKRGKSDTGRTNLALVCLAAIFAPLARTEATQQKRPTVPSLNRPRAGRRTNNRHVCDPVPRRIPGGG